MDHQRRQRVKCLGGVALAAALVLFLHARRANPPLNPDVYALDEVTGRPCVLDYANCNDGLGTPCCGEATGGMKCFQKDLFESQCRRVCPTTTPGFGDPPWACAAAPPNSPSGEGAGAPPASSSHGGGGGGGGVPVAGGDAACVETFQECKAGGHACCSVADKCFAKSPTYSQCRSKCMMDKGWDCEAEEEARIAELVAANKSVAAHCYGGRTAPSVWVIGCQKCGTTSLWWDVVTHLPGVTTGEFKESHYWSAGNQAERSVDASLAQYVQLYPPCFDWQHPKIPKEDMLVAMDFDPLMSHPGVAQQIKTAYTVGLGAQVLPQLRFVALLRDPVARVESFFYHAVAEKFIMFTEGFIRSFSPGHYNPAFCDCPTAANRDECCSKPYTNDERYAYFLSLDVTFDQWAAAELDAAQDCAAAPEAMRHIGKDFEEWGVEMNADGTTDLWPGCGQSGLFGGLYVYQLRAFAQAFGAGSLTVVPSDVYFARADLVLEALSAIAGSDFTSAAAFGASSKNVGAVRESGGEHRAPMAEATRARLSAFYDPYNDELYRYIEDHAIPVVKMPGTPREFL